MNSTIDDTDTPVSYSVTPSWNTNIWDQQVPQPLFSSNHGSPNPGAYMTLTFSGTAVYVYGFKGNDHGFRDVSIDSNPPTRCDGRNGEQGSRALVYWADGLSPGQHNITIKHTGNQGQYLNIDYFIVSTATSGTSQPTPQPIGIIAGIVAGAAVLSLVVTIWIFWWWRRKASRQAKKGSNGTEENDWKPRLATPAVASTPNVLTIHPFYAQAQGAERSVSETTLTYTPGQQRVVSPYSKSKPGFVTPGTTQNSPVSSALSAPSIQSTLGSVSSSPRSGSSSSPNSFSTLLEQRPSISEALSNSVSFPIVAAGQRRNGAGAHPTGQHPVTDDLVPPPGYAVTVQTGIAL
ncbi:hypothetical protein M408DRAFT_20762 [Serendipita vermifera MAFF 305830]|uniref:Uncharacterized protein n=1 Tax=Serendipita vermifera MAFF 305830 TaxID=933852 RepID=A0A0C2XUB8_SERVB|nr:hypothetical protein M408DRAFT_20762 [Serendipita vermifera MAFF 305830]